MSGRLVDSLGHDLNRLPEPKKKNKNLWSSLIIDFVTVAFFSVCVFAFVNFPSLVLIGQYLVTPEKVMYEFPTKQEITEQKVAVVQSKDAPGVKQYPDNMIFIPKIGVQAPIGWDTKNSELTTALEKNVVHLEGTSKPGGIGNIFLTGHSSNYWWKEGDYNSVFALLPQLGENDEIVVTYQGEFHHYRVTGKQEMRKDEVSAHLEASSEKLTIMTCVPVGTNLRRMLIYAQPID